MTTEENRTLTFFWQIENLSFWEPGADGTRKITSPYFRREPLCYIQLLPKGRDENDKYVRVKLCIVSNLNYTVDCELSLVDSGRSPLVTGVVLNHVMEAFTILDLTDCPTQEEVFDTRKLEFLPLDILSVRCRIWKSRGSFPTAILISARSRIEVKGKSSLCRIEGFSDLQLGEKVTTPIEIDRREDWLLNFSFTGESLDDANVTIEIANGNVEKASLVTITVSVLDNRKKVLKSVDKKHRFVELHHKQKCVLQNFLSRREVLEKMPTCLEGNVLTLLCEITAIHDDISEFIERIRSGPSNASTDFSRNASTFTEPSCLVLDQSDDVPELTNSNRSDSVAILLKDFMSLYQDQILCDFELRSGDISFPVHRVVLSARSSVFKAMFSSDMKESNSNSLEVPDLDACTLKRMLTFLYSGTMEPELQFEDALNLYYAADKYQVESLKQQCSTVLRSRISVSNVSDILRLADRHQDLELKSFVRDFILVRLDRVMPSDEWGRFLGYDPHLAGTTMRQVYKKKLQVMSCE